MNYLVLFFIGIGALWGAGVLLGYFFTDKRCEGCKHWGDAEYMVETKDGKFYHFSCFPPTGSVESPHSPSK